MRTIELEIDASTTYATAYRDGKPVATVQRRRVYTKGPYWRAFDLNGAELFNTVSNVSARYLASRIESTLAAKALPAPYRTQREANGLWSAYYGAGFMCGGFASEARATTWIREFVAI